MTQYYVVEELLKFVTVLFIVLEYEANVLHSIRSFSKLLSEPITSSDRSSGPGTCLIREYEHICVETLSSDNDSL